MIVNSKPRFDSVHSLTWHKYFKAICIQIFSTCVLLLPSCLYIDSICAVGLYLILNKQPWASPIKERHSSVWLDTAFHSSLLFSYLLLRTQRDSFQLPEVEAGVGLDVPRPQHRKVPVSSPALLPDFTQVCLDGKQPPLTAAGESKDIFILQQLQYRKGDKLIIILHVNMLNPI